MSNKLQQLGIDRWPVADRLALLDELRDNLSDDSIGSSSSRRTADRAQSRREQTDSIRPWRDAITDLGGEG